MLVNRTITIHIILVEQSIPIMHARMQQSEMTVGKYWY